VRPTNGLLEMTQEKRPATTTSGQKQKLTAHHRVLNLNVTGGFLSGVHLEFADGLNCLIGGRGAGKTTVLEFLRFGLGLMPDPKVSAARFRAIDGLVKANLGNGRLTIELRTKTDMKYKAARSVDDTVQVLNEIGTADQGFKGISLLRNELKPILGAVDIIKSHYHGNYSLEPGVTIGELCCDKLLEIGDQTISELAKVLQNQALGPPKKAEGNSGEFPTHRRRR